jgi:two-component system, cell cycle sensor histidine kinase and response regulator CckA
MPAEATGSEQGALGADLARLVLDVLPDEVGLKDSSGRYLLANRALCKRLGLPESEVIGRTDRELGADCHDGSARGGPEYQEVPLPLAAGPGLQGGVVAVGREQAPDAAEGELLRVRAILDTTLEQIPVPIVLVSCPDGIIRHVNRACLEFFESTDVPSPIGTPLLSLDRTWQDIERDGRPVPLSEMPLALAMRGIATRARPYGVITRSGALRWDLVTAAPIYGADGTQIAAVVVFPDITGLVRTETALRQSEERYRRLVEMSQDGVWSLGPDQRTTFVNRRMAEMLGCRTEDMIGRPVSDFVFGEDLTANDREMADRREGRDGQYERRLRRADGSAVWASISAVGLYGDDREFLGSFATVRDVSAQKQADDLRKRLEGELQEARKLESIGQLAGGIAHDFNNMLMPVLGYAEILWDDLPEGHPHRNAVRQIIAAAQRARDLTRQLLAFARKQTLALRMLDLNEVISDLEEMLRRTVRENVTIETQLAPSLPAVRGDAGQIGQVILNLAINAQDAMPSGGALTIATACVVVDEGQCDQHRGIASGRYVTMSVSDTGHGIDRATSERIFEPFFTTKAMGTGTGLGLSTVYGIVKQHGGSIAVHSELGEGARFVVYLPQAGATEAAPAPAASDEVATGHETVLVVEDQEHVRVVTCAMLERCGYTVLEAGDGEAALAAAATHGTAIDLLLTDVIMPGLNGRELHERLQAVRPGVPVLYTSGYPSSVIGRHGVLEPGTHFLPKPFTMRDLATKIREAIDRP